MVIYLLGPVTVLLFWRDSNFLGRNVFDTAKSEEAVKFAVKSLINIEPSHLARRSSSYWNAKN